MIEHLKSIAVFAEVVRAGQFRGAAERLNMTPSAVSYHIRVLEDAIGTPLLYRSTRRFTLTSSGELLFNSAEAMLNAAETGFAGARPSESGLSGVLRITLTTALSHSVISERITRFSKKNPDLSLELTYDNRETDLVAEGIDVALRIGRLRDSSLLCKHIWDMPRTLVASPVFEAAYGPFRRPADLKGVPWIRFAGLEKSRTLIDEKGTKFQIEQSGNLCVNSIEAMVDFTLNGAGLSSPPTHFVAKNLVTGELIRCLSDTRMSDLPVYAVWHRTVVPSPAVRDFIDCVTGHWTEDLVGED
ncbi:LysR family transcriptional regulator [uncultured Roseobacter sp.]|uniref:LysR family transcriptional regulator n=1 Tax=uncultured Roseobacter sp. TaxID=114847 RepID=UPI0026022688|nr:LysR family transcriptional regulator [uncultured Roseobacter sp.]